MMTETTEQATPDALAVLHGDVKASVFRRDHYGTRLLLTKTQAAKVHEIRMFWSAWKKLGSPETFTLPELRRAYEELLEEHQDQRNFQRDILATGLVEDSGGRQRGVPGRPAVIYRLATSTI